MDEKRFDAREALGYGWGVTKRKLGFFIVFFLLVACVWIAADQLVEFLLPHFLEKTGELAVQALIGIVVVWCSLRVFDGREVDWRRAYASGTVVGNYLLTQLLYCLIVAGGLILLIIPGIIWAVQFGYAGYVVLDEGLSPVDALKRSAQLTRGSRTELVLLALLLIGVNLLGALALVIGLFASVPTTWMAWTWTYRRLQGQTVGVPVPPPPPRDVLPGSSI